MSRKAPTPIRSAPSSAPLEAMVAKQQSHIDELVMKNRSLEQAMNKLRAELTGEKGRWETTIQQLKQQSKEEQAEWKEGCDSLQRLWKIEHLRAVVDLEKGRTTVIKLREELRVARLARLQRDFQIGMFQAKESELEDRIQQLSYDLEVKGRGNEVDAQVVESLTEDLQEAREQLESSVEEKKQLEKTLSGLRAEHTKVVSSSSTDTAALERSKLEVEGLQSSLADLQEKFNDLQRTNSDLLRQLEKWRKIESREDGELETLRKRKIDLEVKVKEYEGRVADAALAERERDKLQVKIQKYKVSLEEHQTALDDANKELDEREILFDELRAKNTELEAKVKSMALSLKASQSHISPQSARPSSSKALFINDEAGIDDRDSTRSPSPPSPPKRAVKPKPKPVAKKKPIPTEDSDVQVVDEPHPTQQPDISFNVDFGDEDNIEKVVPVKKNKGKAKATAPVASAPAKRPRGRPKKLQETPSTEPEDVEARSTVAGDKRKGKRKANDITSDASVDSQPKKRTKKAPVADDSDSEPVAPLKPPPKKKDAPKPPPKPKPKPKARETSPAPGDDASGTSVAPKKKKRKINIFAQSDAPPSFDFGLKALSQGGDSGLNIPMELSPVKDGDPSMLGKALSSLGTSNRR